MTAAAALAFGGLFMSCSHDDITTGNGSISVIDNYEQAFISRFGQPAANQTWGFEDFNAQETPATTRAATIGNDVYNQFNLPTAQELTNAFPPSIPEGADEVADLERLYKGKDIPGVPDRQFYDLDWIYQYQVTKGYNLKITKSGEVSVGYFQNGVDNLFNVYVEVEGNVTIKRPKNGFFNLYILKGNVTLDSNFGEMAGMISVAKGATLNDTRDHLAANDGIKVFNRGTYNTSGDYKIGNNAYFYNQGKFYIKNGKGNLEVNPGSGKTPYFFNNGDDAEFKAASFKLDSEGGFISDGNVTITGATSVTQQGITWVNNGHYTTDYLIFSAKNCTFYNYCQLIVTNETRFTDGEFNLMSGSYAEMKYGLFNNFIVNMYDNSSISITDGSKWGRQGDGTYQGFKAVNDNAKVYVRLGGTNYVPVQQEGSLRIQGAKMTFAYETMRFFENYNNIDQYSNFSGINYWDETNQAKLNDKKDPRIEWNKNNVPADQIITGEDFAKTGFTLKDGECAATWKPGTRTPGEGIRIIAEDLTVGEYSDFDFNDVVFDVEFDEDRNKTVITLQAAGGTLPLTVGWEGNDDSTDGTWKNYEVHYLFGFYSTGVMINTGNEYSLSAAPVTLTLNGLYNKNANSIPVKVKKNGEWITLTAVRGKVASKICVTTDYEWCDERDDIETVYPAFPQWVKDGVTQWY